MKIEQVRMPGCNIVERTWPNGYNIMQHPQMLHEKFDQVQIWANNTQHVVTRRNTLQKGGQTHATCCSQQCCDMLRWNVAIVWSGLKLSNIKSFKMALFSISQSVRRYTVIMKTWKLVSTSLACCSVQRAWLWLGYCLTVSRFKFSFVPWPVDCSSRGLHKLNEHLQLKGTESI